MKINLYKLLGVEEGEEFKREGSNYDYRYRVYNNRIQHFDEVFKIWEYSTLTVNALATSEIIKLPKKKQFSQDTLNFFKYIDKKWKWIAKDNNESVRVFQNKPTKNSRYWETENEFEETRSLSTINQNLFQSIKWEDEEPIYIDNYVDRC